MHYTAIIAIQLEAPSKEDAQRQAQECTHDLNDQSQLVCTKVVSVTKDTELGSCAAF